MHHILIEVNFITRAYNKIKLFYTFIFFFAISGKEFFAGGESLKIYTYSQTIL